MNDYELNRIGQMLQRSGDAFLSILLQDLGCGYGTGTAYRDREVYVPTPTGDGYYLVSMVTEGHNFPMAIRGRDRSFTILDSMFQEDSAHIMRVIEYLTGLGYTYVPHGCPVNRLPQQNDTLCTIWTLYLIYRVCKGDDPSTLIYSANKDSLYVFATYAYQLFIRSGLYASIQRLHSIMLDYMLSGMPIDTMAILEAYKHAGDKNRYLDIIDREFPITNECHREWASYSLLSGILSTSEIPSEVRTSLSSACTIRDILSVIYRTYDSQATGDILFLASLSMLGDSEGLLDPMYSVPSDDEASIIYEYALARIDRLVATGDSLGIYPTASITALEYLDMVNEIQGTPML